MLTLRAISTRFNLPENAAIWLLEGCIALVLSGYTAYAAYRPLARALSQVFTVQKAEVTAAALLCVLVVPVLWVALFMLVVQTAALLKSSVRPWLDVLLLTALITILALPAIRELGNGPALQPEQSARVIHAVHTGPLNTAPAPLKVERIPLGAELWNTGTQPFDVNVWFVSVNARGRTYCAGTPLKPPVAGRSRLAAGESLVFTSGNCQRGGVGLTVWDASGRRIYQTSVVLETGP